MCSCSRPIENVPVELFTYSYDYQFYGLDNNNCNFKASTVSTLKSSIDNQVTSIFMISSPTCLSCKVFAEAVNDVAINKQISVYTIDPYNELYPVINTSDFDVLLDILKDVGINSEKDYVMPILLIINRGVIDDYIVGYDTSQNYDSLTKTVEQVINKSLLIK